MSFFFGKNTYLRKKLFRLSSLLLVALLAFFSFGCEQKIDYFDYVSELRNNIFLAETEELTLKIYAVEKESPYAADGIKQETSPRFEARLLAPSGEQNVTLSFTVGNRSYGGDMSFDNVRQEYYYFCTLDVAEQSTIPCRLQYGEKEISITATSVLKKECLSPKDALNTLTKEKAELFQAMTDKYGFAGEIYVRLIYEDSPYYYIGVIDRTGKINAFLLNASTGKILARREG